MDFTATAVPAALTLQPGAVYDGQNVSNTGTLFVREATSIPAVTDRGFRVESGGHFEVAGPWPGTADIWLWTDSEADCAVILTVAP